MVRVNGRAPAPAVNSSVRWTHDLPLLLAGVLRLVDQHVVDAEIELVVHPGGIDVAQERQRLVDEIVVVEQSAALLFLQVALQHLIGDGEQRRAAVAAGHGAAAFEQSADALLLPAKPLHQSGVLDRLGDDGFPRRAARRCRRFADSWRRVRRPAAPRDPRSGSPVRCRSCCPRAKVFASAGHSDGAISEPVKYSASIFAASSDGSTPSDFDRLASARVAVARGHDRAALADCFPHDVAERLIGRRDHRRGQRAAELAVGRVGAFEQHVERQLLEKLGVLGVVEHVEARGDIGLERELMQQLGAESVDGVHLQPARGVERAREQAPRQRAPRGVGLEARALANGFVEAGIVERGPFGERVEHALGHVGGGGLGESDAEDFFRLDAVEQKVDHALRPARGSCPSRHWRRPTPTRPDWRRRAAARARNSGMTPGGLIRRLRTSSAAPPVLDHSLTRARWS